MKRTPPVDFDPQHVSTFLDKIARDRDAEIHRIIERQQTDISHIRRQAFAESRRLHHKTAQQLRERLTVERDRFLASVRTDLRRRRWEILADSQQRALQQVWARFLEAWQNPELQWAWCRSWLDVARRDTHNADLTITCGEGTHPSVRQRIAAEMQEHQVQCTVQVDETAPPGIVVQWQDHVLDGTLRSQCPVVSETLLRRFAGLLHREGGTKS